MSYYHLICDNCAAAGVGGRCHETCMNFGQLNCWGSGPDQCQKRELATVI